MATIGFIGLGAMGGRMAGRLLAAGHEVHGTNRSPAKAEPLIERGLRWQDTPREVARAADITFSMVTDDDALRDVMKGPDGVLAGLVRGPRAHRHEHGQPELSRDYAERARAIGAELIEAPGLRQHPRRRGRQPGHHGRGDEAAFHRVEPLLRELGSTVTYVGANGQALLLKLAVNISLGAQILALSEGVLLAERGGIEPQARRRRHHRQRGRLPRRARPRPAGPRPAGAGVVRRVADAEGHPPRPRRRNRPRRALPTTDLVDRTLTKARASGTPTGTSPRSSTPWRRWTEDELDHRARPTA